MMLTIYIICFNEEVLLPFTLEFYRIRHPDAKIVVYDNQSTDSTVVIARNAGCEVISFDTGDTICDKTYLEIKNNCWKSATTPWVAVIDCDEWLNVDSVTLGIEDKMQVSLIRSEAYEMVNMHDNLDIKGITTGVRTEYTAVFYDKILLFNKNVIKEINYIPGAHSCTPIGEGRYSVGAYFMYHYSFISPDYKVERYKLYASRLSEENRKNSWGGQYLHPEQHIRAEFENYRQMSIKLL